MIRRVSLCSALVALAAGTFIFAEQAKIDSARLVELRVDDLNAPLGIDDPAPQFSWQLSDPARGARQAAYQVEVFSSPALAAANKPDWSSGRVASDQSLNVHYAGPALEPSHRYTLRVKVWVAHRIAPAEATPVIAESSWETGLLHQEAWSADWIGYETAEEDAVRHAAATWITNPDVGSADGGAADAGGATERHFAFRQTLMLDKPVAHAALFATGEDTVSAWVNGHQVLTAQPFPPWKQMPWKKFVRADATAAVVAGANTIAIETVHYIANPNGMADRSAPPTIATLFVEFTDGTTATFSTGPDWKTAVRAAEGWQKSGFDDSGWKAAVTASGDLGHPWIPDSVKAFRHPFEVKAAVKSARIYATALGAYELFLNNERVGDQVLAPGWTDYREHVRYQTYDVTKQIDEENYVQVLGAFLAPGWYSTPLEWFQQPNNYGDTPPALRVQLRIEYADGSVQWVTTDPGWLASVTSIQHSEIYDGETDDEGDAELDSVSMGRYEPSYKDLDKVIEVVPQHISVEAQDFPSIRVERTLEPKTMTEPKPGVYVYDFGQNFSGVEDIKVSGPRGADVQARFAEIVNSDGTLYTDNLRTAKATDHFILSGIGHEEFMPQFTFHGFRYMEITGLPAAPAKDAVSALVIHTDAPFTAKLETGSPMINQLWSNILWGQRSNFVGIPTDCPQRDERLGWMADAQVFWRAANYNMGLAAFSRKFSADMRGTQVGTPYYGIYSPGTARPNMGTGAGWSDAGVVIPWTSWLQTGDTQIIEDNWAAMQKYLDAVNAANPDGLWIHQAGTAFGDWLSPEGKTDFGLIATAYWAYDVTLMRQMAHATGRTADEAKYAGLFEKIRAAFVKKYVHDDGFVAGADNSPSPFGQINNPNAKSHGGDTQTGYVLALHMNLLPAELRAKAATKLAAKIEANNGLLATGFLGTPYLLEELTKAGYTKLAYKLLLNTEYPSWGYLIGHGATTMWERWNGDQMKGDPSMNSYNHYAYGAVADWIYRYAAGVDTTPLDAGFHTIVLHPIFDERLGWIRFDYDSSYGPIHSDWKVSGKRAEWHLTIPANTSGWLPLAADEAAKYKLDGVPLKRSMLAKAETRDGEAGFVLAPGQYTFSVEIDTAI